MDNENRKKAILPSCRNESEPWRMALGEMTYTRVTEPAKAVMLELMPCYLAYRGP